VGADLLLSAARNVTGRVLIDLHDHFFPTGCDSVGKVAITTTPDVFPVATDRHRTDDFQTRPSGGRSPLPFSSIHSNGGACRALIAFRQIPALPENVSFAGEERDGPAWFLPRCG